MKILRSKRDTQSLSDYENTKQLLFRILDQKEIFWRQRSKQLWLKAGEKNTIYFHEACNKRRRHNYIQKLRNEQGDWCSWQTGLQDVIKEYYQQLFTADQTQGEVVLNCINQTITEQQNEILLEPVSAEEVKDVVFHMHPDKAPGPDGMTPTFFQRNWNVVREEVIQMVKDFFETGMLLDGINDTNIVLIPKK